MKDYVLIKKDNMGAEEIVSFDKEKLEHLLLQAKMSMNEDSDFCIVCREMINSVDIVLRYIEKDKVEDFWYNRRGDEF